MSHLESVDNALKLVVILAEGQRVTVTEVARELGVAPSTAHRLLGTLVYRGFAQQSGDRSYGMGPAMLAFRGNPRTRTYLLDMGQPHLRRLTQVTNETSHLAILVQRELRFLISEEAHQLLRIGSRAGQVMPAHQTAAGKTLLADLRTDEFDALYRGADGSSGLTPHAVDALARELASVRRRGYAVNRGESERGLSAVAVPVIAGESRRAVASITLSLPTVRYSSARVAGLVDALREAAVAIAAELRE